MEIYKSRNANNNFDIFTMNQTQRKKYVDTHKVSADADQFH